MSTREAIVAAATALVDRDCAVTLRAVSREAVVPTSSIYPHFPDSTAILLAVCRAAFADLSAAVLGAADVYTAGLAYLDFAEPALLLFTRIVASGDAMTLWRGLHGLADQRASIRSPRFSALAPRLITSLSGGPHHEHHRDPHRRSG